MRLAPLLAVISVALLAAPSTATHPTATMVPYVLGGTVQVDGFSRGALYCSNTWWSLGQGCLGGGFPQAPGHGAYDFATGYTWVAVLVVDEMSGPSVGAAVCLKPSWDDTTCTNADPFGTGCGIGIVVDTDGAFRTIFAAVFLRSLYVDSSTSTVCLGTRGTLAAVFSP